MSEGLSPEIVRARVPVSQRAVPVASFVITSIGGSLCAWWTLQLFQRLRDDDTATVKGLMNSLGSINQAVVPIYLLALVVGVIGIAVIVMRSDEEEATLPGFAYLAGLPCLISPALSAYGLYIAIAAFQAAEKIDFANLGARIATIEIFSLIAGAVAPVMALPIALLPISVPVGKRISPIFGIGTVLIGTMILLAITFWLIGFSQEPTNPIFGK